MMPVNDQLPGLREDLEIRFLSRNGAAVAQLYDPLRHRFFDLSENSTMMLRLWGAGTQTALMAAAARVRAAFTPNDLEVFRRFLISNNLVKTGQSTALLDRQRQQANSFRARFSKVLFLRLPLGNPTAFLTVIAPFVLPFFTRWFFWLSMVALALGLYLLSEMPEQVKTQITAIASLQGAVSLIVAAIIAKVFHELGHAMQALIRAVPVTGWGIIFMLGLPLPYTELSATWRLENARDRMFIAAGGLLSEAVLACWMILLFGFLPEGELRTLVFSVATVSILLSLAINLNPLMRFDGYHILSDALSVKNLQARSDAFGKWWLRRQLFGLRDPEPEAVDRAGRRILISFALAVWVYRFFLYLGIALVLFAVLPLVLGAPLAVMALAVFIGFPLVTEMRVWLSKHAQIRRSFRAWVTFGILAGLIALLFVPMARSHRVPARLGPVDSVVLTAPKDAIVARRAAFDPRQVSKGALLWQLDDPILAFEIARLQAEKQLLEAQNTQLSTSGTARAQTQILNERARLITARLKEIDTIRAQMQITAPLSGVLTQDHIAFVSGVWVARGTPLTTVSDFTTRKLVAYLPSELRKRVDMDAPVQFFDADGALHVKGVALLGISDQVARKLQEAEFLQGFGGPIAASAADQSSPKDIWHRLEFAPIAAAGIPPLVISGSALLVLAPESAAKRIWRRVLHVLTTELSS